MEPVGTRAKFKVNISVSDIGDGKMLSDADVDVKVTFYTPHAKDVPFNTFVVEKKDMKPLEEGDTSEYACIVETDTLGYGRLMADVEVKYTDEEFGKQIREIYPTETDILLVKSPTA